jgi:alpha-glucosidase
MGSIDWLDGFGEGILAFRNRGLTVIANLSGAAIALPEGSVALSSEPIVAGMLPSDTTAWLV